MQQYDFQVAANATFPIAATGRYIKYVSGNNGGGDVSIVVTPSGQGAAKVVLVPGQAFRVSDQGPTPSGWVLSNSAGGATISGKVVIGDGRIDDPTINGTVQVVDGGKARTLSGTSFIGIGAVNGTAGVYTQVQLWNPGGSGKRLVVEAVGGNVSGNPLVLVWGFTNAALGSVIQQGLSKLAGGAASVAQLQTGTTAVAPTPTLFNMSLPAATSFPEKMNEPIVLPPNYGLICVATTVNNGFGATFEWYEEPNV